MNSEINFVNEFTQKYMFERHRGDTEETQWRHNGRGDTEETQRRHRGDTEETERRQRGDTEVIYMGLLCHMRGLALSHARKSN